MRSFFTISLLTLLLMAGAVGCTTSRFMTAENFYRAIYDISTQEQALKDGYPSSGPGQEDIPSYDAYKAGLQY